MITTEFQEAAEELFQGQEAQDIAIVVTFSNGETASIVSSELMHPRSLMEELQGIMLDIALPDTSVKH